MTERARRYEPLVRLAAGGMATVYVGAAYGSLGFRQLVAIKKPHRHLLEDPAYRKALLAEATLASMLRHANVVDVRDVYERGTDVQLVMDYVEGTTLGAMMKFHFTRSTRLPLAVSLRIVLDALAGLHAAHELRDGHGSRVGLIHRDVSPDNVLVGVDGVARVTDFGIAKSTHGERTATTGDSLKGKLPYMAPEYLRGETCDRRIDVFASGVLLWEALAGRRLFKGEHDADSMRKVLFDVPASLAAEGCPASLDAVLQRALAKDPRHRFETAEAMAAAIDAVVVAESLYAPARAVAAEVQTTCGPALLERHEEVMTALQEFLAASSMLPVVPPRATTLPLISPNPVTHSQAALPPAAPPLRAGRTLLSPQQSEPAPRRSPRSWWAAAALLLVVGAGFVVGRTLPERSKARSAVSAEPSLALPSAVPWADGSVRGADAVTSAPSAASRVPSPSASTLAVSPARPSSRSRTAGPSIEPPAAAQPPPAQPPAAAPPPNPY